MRIQYLQLLPLAQTLHVALIFLGIVLLLMGRLLLNIAIVFEVIDALISDLWLDLGVVELHVVHLDKLWRLQGET